MVTSSVMGARKICLRKRLAVDRGLSGRGFICQNPDYFLKNLRSFEADPEPLSVADRLLAMFANEAITLYCGCMSGKGTIRLTALHTFHLHFF